jgi:hypothetical protein
VVPDYGRAYNGHTTTSVHPEETQPSFLAVLAIIEAELEGMMHHCMILLWKQYYDRIVGRLNAKDKTGYL